jgi:hypothetical protein
MLCSCLLLRLSALSELNYWMIINKQSSTLITLCPPCTLFFAWSCCRLDYLIASSRAPHYNPLLWEGTTDYIQLLYVFSSGGFYIYEWFSTKYSLGKSFLVITKVFMRLNLGSQSLSSLFEKQFYFHLIYILEPCEAQQRDWFLFTNRNLCLSCVMSYLCWHLEPCKATCLCGKIFHDFPN